MDLRLPLRIVAAVVALCAATPPTAAAQTTQSHLGTLMPRSSLAISLPDAINADGELPLEITMTNTSKEDYWFDIAFGPPLWTRLCHLDVRDEAGKPVERKSSMKQFDGWTMSGPALVLRPAEEAQVEVLLNRVYDFSRPGRYTIQAVRSDRGLTVRSNIVTAVFPRPRVKALKKKPSFSVTLSAPYSTIKIGYQLPLKIAITNLSGQRVAVRSWQEDTHAGAGVSHEFSSGIVVLRNSTGGATPWTKQGQDLNKGITFPDGRFGFVWLNAGETFAETKLAGGLYDLGRPGEYEVQVALTDSRTGLVARSNRITVNVVGSEGRPQPETQPPFLLDIRPLSKRALASINSGPGVRSKAAVYLAITNRSDHAIDFDIGAGDNDVDVYDGKGDLAPLTEAGHRYRTPLPRGGFPTQHLEPGETKSGGVIALDWYYDLSHIGRYSAQVRAYDIETRSVVNSNQVTIDLDK